MEKVKVVFNKEVRQGDVLIFDMYGESYEVDGDLYLMANKINYKDFKIGNIFYKIGDKIFTEHTLQIQHIPALDNNEYKIISL